MQLVWEPHFDNKGLGQLGLREGNGNPLQCSCLENPRDGGAWWAAVYGIAQSRTRLKQLSSSSSSWVLLLADVKSSRSQKKKLSFFSMELFGLNFTSHFIMFVFILGRQFWSEVCEGDFTSVVFYLLKPMKFKLQDPSLIQAHFCPFAKVKVWCIWTNLGLCVSPTPLFHLPY